MKNNFCCNHTFIDLFLWHDLVQQTKHAQGDSVFHCNSKYVAYFLRLGEVKRGEKDAPAKGDSSGPSMDKDQKITGHMIYSFKVQIQKRGQTRGDKICGRAVELMQYIQHQRAARNIK